jgi:hypothetical protein
MFAPGYSAQGRMNFASITSGFICVFWLIYSLHQIIRKEKGVFELRAVIAVAHDG